jgi:protein-disulfide isomerase
MSERNQGRLRPAVGADDHRSGPADAPITLVEYGDFECPYCFRAHPIVQALQRRLADRLCFVYRNFPLTELHPHAMHAAEAAESVYASSGADAYWRMHDLIYEHQQDGPDALDDAHLLSYAVLAGADRAIVGRDLAQGTHRERVMADFITGVHSGVNGTPTFYVNGRRYDGTWVDLDAFARALENSALAPR